MTGINSKIDEVIVKVWNMSSSSQESVVRQATLDWAREELRKLFPQPLETQEHYYNTNNPEDGNYAQQEIAIQNL